jgi:ABC-type lipoprotein release transport system permease subunit
LRILLTENAKPMIIGGVAGAFLATALSQMVRSFAILPHREPIDIPAFAAGLVCFALVAVIATLSPALRALRINPAETLRDE